MRHNPKLYITCFITGLLFLTTLISVGFGALNQNLSVAGELEYEYLGSQMIRSWSYNDMRDFHSNTYRTKITSVYFVNNKDYSGSVNYWDVSEDEDNSVIAWVVNDPNQSGYYILYIGAVGYVKANPDSNYLFTNFTALKSISTTYFNTETAINMSHMFAFIDYDTQDPITNNLTSITFGDKFDTSNVTDMSVMFIHCNKLTSLDVTGFDTSSVENFSNMFNDCSSLTSLDVSNFNTSSATDMGAMFASCEKITTFNLTNFDTSDVTNMHSMFYLCYGVTTINLSSFNTGEVTDSEYMFTSCTKLTTLTFGSGCTFAKVTNMHSMFYNLSSMTSLNLTYFNTGSCTNAEYMFNNCSNLTSITFGSNCTFANNKNFHGMFAACTRLPSLNITMFNTRKATNMNYMFYNSSALRTIRVSNSNWVTSGATTTGMFSGCGTSTVTRV